MFTPMMLAQTNSQVSPYYALLTDVWEETPAAEREKKLWVTMAIIYRLRL